MQPEVALGGAVVGFIVGLTGMGGGALMTPLLVLGFGIRPLTAVSSDLVAAVVMKPIGGAVHLRFGTVIRPVVGWLVLGSVPSAFAVVVGARTLWDPASLDSVIETAIGAALLLAAVALISKGAFRRRPRATAATSDLRVRPLATLAIGIVGGAMVGLTSVGSGSLMMVLLLVVYPALTASQLVGTDLVQATPLVASAAAAHLLFGDVDFALTGSLLLGAVPATYLGAHLSARAPDHAIRPLLVIALSASGLKLLGAPSAVVGVITVCLLAAYAAVQVSHLHRRRSVGETIEPTSQPRIIIDPAPGERP